MSSIMAELKNIVHSIKRNYHPDKIILYGSLSLGKVRKGSDIDLVIIKETNKDPWERSEEVDRYIQHNVPIDILVYTPHEIEDRLQINDFFVKDFMEKGKVLYER